MAVFFCLTPREDPFLFPALLLILLACVPPRPEKQNSTPISSALPGTAARTRAVIHPSGSLVPPDSGNPPLENSGTIPFYQVWNQNGAFRYAHFLYDNLHNAILSVNPGEKSVSEEVCIPERACNTHVPTVYDPPETRDLVDRIYSWAISFIGE